MLRDKIVLDKAEIMKFSHLNKSFLTRYKTILASAQRAMAILTLNGIRIRLFTTTWMWKVGRRLNPSREQLNDTHSALLMAKITYCIKIIQRSTAPNNKSLIYHHEYDV